MALIFRGMHHCDKPEILAEICVEYWRQPHHQWNYFEYLYREGKVNALVEAPNEFAIAGAKGGYALDIAQAKRLWPEK